ncbi:DUF1499 domain-containing protein [bacterium]|nr:DUF1499 domain-containing protein [bacterium]
MTNVNPLKPCPNKPNCISTTSQDRHQSMLPLNFKDGLQQSHSLIKKIVSEMPRTQLVSERSDYLHFIFKSTLFGFIDDVEFYFDDSNKIIHFRSASRSGYSDLGVNRKRMTTITEKYTTGF